MIYWRNIRKIIVRAQICHSLAQIHCGRVGDVLFMNPRIPLLLHYNDTLLATHGRITTTTTLAITQTTIAAITQVRKNETKDTYRNIQISFTWCHSSKYFFTFYVKALINEGEEEEAAMEIKRNGYGMKFKSTMYIKPFKLDCDAKKSLLIIPKHSLRPHALSFISHKLE